MNMREPSVYDFIRSLFHSEITIDIRDFVDIKKAEIPRMLINNKEKPALETKNWKIFTGTIAAIFAQTFLEPDSFHIEFAILLYLVALLLVWRGMQASEFNPQPKILNQKKKYNLALKKYPFIISVALLTTSFILFSSNSINWINLFLWISGIVFMVIAFWNPKVKEPRTSKKPDKLFLAIALCSFIIILFFRLFLLNEIPGEMFSDHAEKLLDVLDILNGKYPVFFERNTGREPIQFYISALLIRLFSIEVSYFSLKISTVLFGLLTIPFIYLLAKEGSDKWGGLFAALFAGIGYWPNVISRIGLRYALYPLFVAPVFYFLIRSLKEKNSNLLIISGIFLGLGLNGYSAFRIVPILVAFIFLMYIFNKRTFNEFEESIYAFSIVGFVAISVFLPVMRYWFDHPGSFSYRMLSRLTPIERPFDSSPVIIFIKNFWDSILMPFYKNGQIWVHSVTNRPALDVISASFFFIGMIFLVHRIKYQKKWEFVALLISIPVLMMPSILSLAYPGENPSLNRSAGAYVPIFIIIGIGFTFIKDSILEMFPKKISKIVAMVFCVLVGIISIKNNYKLVFSNYKEQFDRNAWNSSEIGEVITNFVQSGGEKDNAYVIPYPHWVDTRLVGFNARHPGKDYALNRSAISVLSIDEDKKLFIYKPEDFDTNEVLEQYFPDGQISIYYSEVPGKDFIIYTVE